MSSFAAEGHKKSIEAWQAVVYVGREAGKFLGVKKKII